MKTSSLSLTAIVAGIAQAIQPSFSTIQLPKLLLPLLQLRFQVTRALNMFQAKRLTEFTTFG